MKVALQMDPIGVVDITVDSTFRIALEAQYRGHSLFLYTPDRLAFVEGRVIARGWPITLRNEPGNHVSYEAEKEVDLSSFDVVWLRQDPPFDMGYITTTHLLEMISDTTLVVNNPFWVRNFPEKILVLRFSDLIPPTAIARDIDIIRAFQKRHRDIVIKPLYGNGGAGVFRLKEGDANLSSLHEMFTAINREPVIVQKFLPAVQKGDKRVILVDGKPVGAINRIPQTGEIRSNLHVGGVAEPVVLTPRDIEICEKIGPVLHENGQIFVGIDIIGDYLTEINVTSPTGIQQLERFDGTNAAQKIWEVIEARRAN